MKLLKIGILVLIIPLSGRSQGKDNIEFSLFNIYNKQGRYTSQFGNVAYTNDLKLYGTDLGFKIDYKRHVYGKTYVKVGMGYMEFGVSKIENQTATGNYITISDSRPINYPSSTFLLYSTTKYHYNTLLYHLGVERQFSISRTLLFYAGLDYFYAFSLSQKYYIPKVQTYYNTSNQKGLGSFFNLNLGISKTFGNFSFLPALVIPVYKSWRQDVVFYENPNNTISNWGNGIGISLSVSYH